MSGYKLLTGKIVGYNWMIEKLKQSKLTTVQTGNLLKAVYGSIAQVDPVLWICIIQSSNSSTGPQLQWGPSDESSIWKLKDRPSDDS